jgi:hypothetical protein
MNEKLAQTAPGADFYSTADGGKVPLRLRSR